MNKLFVCGATIAALALLLLPHSAHAQEVVLPKDTDVVLKFDQSLSSKNVKPGDTVRLYVANDVSAGGNVVIRKGTPVTGTITKVSKPGRYGVNGKIRIVLSPAHSVTGQAIPLEPKGKGSPLQGSRTDHAAEATGAGAVVLGPIGLAAGYFIPGKSVNIHRGDVLATTVAQDVRITRR